MPAAVVTSGECGEPACAPGPWCGWPYSWRSGACRQCLWQAQAPPFVVLLPGLHGNSEMRVQIAGGEDLIAIVGRLQSCAAAVQAVSNDVVDVASIMWSTCARSWWQCCGYERRHRSASESARRTFCCVVPRGDLEATIHANKLNLFLA